METLNLGWVGAFNLLTESLFKIGETPVTILGLFRVVLIITVALTLSSLLRRMLAKIAAHNEGENPALYTVGRLAHYVILLVGMMIALSSIGLDFSNIALVAGALSVGIGFGLQSIVNNFVSGLILLFERSLNVGDFIELDSGVLGVVMEINVRSTLINTNDNVDIIVPNSELVSAKVTNWTLRDTTRRMRIPFGVAYGTDKDLVRKAVLEAADRVPETLKGAKKHQPQVWLVRFGDSSLDFELVVWVSQAAAKRPAGVSAAYMWEIETSLRQYEIEIPFPQRDLHIRSHFEQNEPGTVLTGNDSE
ncbi:potassium transporter KefA [Motiliproteus sp. MSK22-1]|nr:potassium transporter KefA [Motiliproteus sp. MSK22-1]